MIQYKLKVLLTFSKLQIKEDLRNMKRWQKKFLKNLVRALEIGANVGPAFASRSPKAALSSLPEVIYLYHTGKGLYLGTIV